ncbi:MAG: PAS domain-containing protein [Armatimonadetes bacterium]|nr:PAS domain-containing protein [Armatimonadota bacterium]
MDLNLIALSITAATTALLGLVALTRAGDRPQNKLFALNAFLVAVWAVLTCRLQVATNVEIARFLLQLVHLVSVLVLATLIDFIWVFPDKLSFGPSHKRFFLYGSALAVGAVAASPPLIRSVSLTARGPDVQFGWPLYVLAAYVAPLALYANIVLWRKCCALRGVARVQAIYVLVGAAASEAFVFVANVVLPAVKHTTVYARWGVVGTLLYCFAIAVAVAKHRLWDLGSVARRLAAAALSVVGVTALATVALYLLLPWATKEQTNAVTQAGLWLLLGGALGFVIVPAYDFFRGLFSRTLQEEKERIVRLLRALGEAVVYSRSDEPALLPILRQTQQFFGAELVEAYVLGAEGDYRRAGAVHASDGPAVAVVEKLGEQMPAEVVAALGLEHISSTIDLAHLARFGSVEETKKKLAALEAMRAEVVVPMRWRGNTVGVLVVGPKLSRDMYNASEIELLESCASHAAIALKNAELRAQILAEKERTDRVLAQMESGVIVVDTTAHIRLVNPAACRLLNKPEVDLLNHEIDALPSTLRGLLQTTLATGRAWSGSRVYLDEEQILPVACSVIALHGPGGKLEGAALVFRDLRTEDALRQAQQETERLRFVRAISAGLAHEIRNPLVAIRTFAELAPVRLDDPEFRESFFDVTKAEVERLEELVTQFMTLARPASVLREPVVLEELVSNAVRAVSARAEAADIELEVEIPDQCPRIEGDASRLYQAISNLLINALDETPQGGKIRVSIEVHDPAAGNGRQPGEAEVALTVWNSGSYIPPEDRARIFEPFYTKKAQGTGLGLAICHTIVDEHHGKISVESREGEGTGFIIRLPLLVPSQSETVTAQ